MYHSIRGYTFPGVCRNLNLVYKTIKCLCKVKHTLYVGTLCRPSHTYNTRVRNRLVVKRTQHIMLCLKTPFQDELTVLYTVHGNKYVMLYKPDRVTCTCMSAHNTCVYVYLVCTNTCLRVPPLL